MSEVGKLFLKGPESVGVEGLSVSVATIYFCCCAKAAINSKYSTLNEQGWLVIYRLGVGQGRSLLTPGLGIDVHTHTVVTYTVCYTILF